MAIAKPKSPIPEITGILGKEDRTRAQFSALAISICKSRHSTILRGKTAMPPGGSAKRHARVTVYCNCDLMYKWFTPLQLKELEKDRQEYNETAAKWVSDAYRYWMKICMTKELKREFLLGEIHYDNAKANTNTPYYFGTNTYYATGFYRIYCTGWYALWLNPPDPPHCRDEVTCPTPSRKIYAWCGTCEFWAGKRQGIRILYGPEDRSVMSARVEPGKLQIFHPGGKIGLYFHDIQPAWDNSADATYKLYALFP